MGLRKVLASKIFIFFVGIILVFVVVNLGKELYRKYQIQKEIDSLQSEVSNLKNSNQQLAELIDYFKTENFAEIEARKKLNLQKEDENVLVVNIANSNITENTSTKVSENVLEEKEIPKEVKVKRSNLRKWWDYFFN